MKGAKEAIMVTVRCASVSRVQFTNFPKLIQGFISTIPVCTDWELSDSVLTLTEATILDLSNFTQRETF